MEGTPPARKDTEFSYAAEILITKSELTDKNRRVFTLQQQVDETKTESEYQLRLKDNKYIEEGRWVVIQERFVRSNINKKFHSYLKISIMKFSMSFCLLNCFENTFAKSILPSAPFVNILKTISIQISLK